MKNFSLNARLKSFVYAYRGLLFFFRKEPNARIHLLLAILAVCAGFIFELSINEWIWVILAIILVFVTELINTSIETLTDISSPEFNEKAGMVKDLAAAAVLISAAFALVIASLIFIPKIIFYFRNNNYF